MLNKVRRVKGDVVEGEDKLIRVSKESALAVKLLDYCKKNLRFSFSFGDAARKQAHQPTESMLPILHS